MKIDINNLPSGDNILHHMIADLVEEMLSLKNQNKSLQDQIKSLQEQLTLLKAKRFGKSSEKLEKQISELEHRIEEAEVSDAASEKDDNKDDSVEPEDTTAESPKNHPKREKLPAHLPREDNVIPPPTICPDCEGTEFRKIADDVSEILEYTPSYFKVIHNIRPRCACTKCERIVQGFPASQTIAKGKAGSGLLAHIILQKYCNHLPFYRQSQMYGYEDIDISRSTMASWAGQCARLLTPLIEAIKKAVFSSPQIHGDDTTIRVLDSEFGKTKTGRIWTYVRDGRPHGDLKTPPAVCYFYSPDRKGERPAEHLKGFDGILHADAYAGYDQLYIGNKNNPDATITEAACWAHTRRKFYEVTQANDKASIAQDALEKIGEIYKIEDGIRGLKPGQRKKVRQAKSKSLVKKLFASWKKSYALLPKKSTTAQAIAYAQNNQAALMRFLDNGKIEIDNNAAERAMRAIAIGRKNWLFAGSDRGGDTAAALYTIIETVKLNNINPWKYLQKVLSVIQDHNSCKIEELLPWNLKLE